MSSLFRLTPVPEIMILSSFQSFTQTFVLAYVYIVCYKFEKRVFFSLEDVKRPSSWRQYKGVLNHVTSFVLVLILSTIICQYQTLCRSAWGPFGPFQPLPVQSLLSSAMQMLRSAPSQKHVLFAKTTTVPSIRYSTAP